MTKKGSSIKFTAVNRLAELKWARAGWVIPPSDCAEHIAELVDGPFAALKAALEDDKVKVKSSMTRLIEHNQSRVKLMILTSLKEVSPTSKARSGLKAEAASTRVARVIDKLFRELNSAVLLGKVTDSASQAPVVLHLSILEQQISDGVSAYMSDWR